MELNSPKLLVKWGKMPGSDTEAEFVVIPETIRMLKQISQEVVVIGIVGQYRKGKSYIMNKIAGLSDGKGFEVGSTVEAKTAGVWIMRVSGDRDTTRCYLLLDTQGFGNPKDRNNERTTRMFMTLLTFASSVLIFNGENVVNATELQGLLTDGVRFARCLSQDNVQLNSIEPKPKAALVYLLRNFDLELTVDGRTATEEEYLEDALKASDKQGLALLSYFNKRKLVTLPKLTSEESKTVATEKLDYLKKYVFSGSPVFSWNGGQRATVTMWATMFERAIIDMNKGVKVPPFRDYASLMFQIESDIAVQEFNKKLSADTNSSSADGAFQRIIVEALQTFRSKAPYADDKEMCKLEERFDGCIAEIKRYRSREDQSHRNIIIAGAIGVGVGAAVVGAGVAAATVAAAAATGGGAEVMTGAAILITPLVTGLLRKAVFPS